MVNTERLCKSSRSFVRKGDQLEIKESIGKLLLNENGISEAHFEIWKISSDGMNTENPSYWLSR